MFLVLVSILAVLVAQENAASLGAPAAIRVFQARLPVINSTAQQTEAVPVALSPFQEIEKTNRKASLNVPEQTFPQSLQDEENRVTITIPHHLTVNTNLQNNDTQEFISSEDTNDTTTERTASTVYDFQSSTMQERSFEELLNLARMKYLGHDLRYRCQYVHILTCYFALE